jgi:23S rRNA (cytosine1962-C5)-methyltransferase
VRTPSFLSAENATAPCVAFEDSHLLVVRKPAGWNTHAPTPFAGEGIYDWLRSRESRWASLSIIHRLDKETSGLLVFGKTTLANRSLTQQFSDRKVLKEYILWTDAKPASEKLVTRSVIVRRGDRYEAVAHAREGSTAETHFVTLEKGSHWIVQARPITGRTHQIRVHAAKEGFPVLGDQLYGGAPFHRMCLHSQVLAFDHPETGERMRFCWEPDFSAHPAAERRRAIIVPGQTSAFRAVHGAADGCPGWLVDRLGPYELSQSASLPGDSELRDLPYAAQIGGSLDPEGRYHKILDRKVGVSAPEELHPLHVGGKLAPEAFPVVENGVSYELSMNEGYSVGLFFDQRDNRRRLLTGYIAPGFVMKPVPPSATLLNTFAYTCGFSLCGALGGYQCTSIDLSRKYLDWGRRNFEANGLDPAKHDWIYGDVINWLTRLAKKERKFDVVLLDPPTFSRSKEGRSFSAERDYGKLVELAVALVAKGGVLFASTNAARVEPEAFCATVKDAVRAMRRTVGRSHFVPQPPDFPITPKAPGYLKTFWVRLDTPVSGDLPQSDPILALPSDEHPD